MQDEGEYCVIRRKEQREQWARDQLGHPAATRGRAFERTGVKRLDEHRVGVAEERLRVAAELNEKIGAGLDATEPLAQEVDHPDRRDEYVTEAGSLHLRQLGPPVLLMLVVGGIGLLAAAAATGGATLTWQVGGLMAGPAAELRKADYLSILPNVLCY